MKKFKLTTAIALLLTVLAACGGGGGGGGTSNNGNNNNDNNGNTTTQPTSARLKISASGTLAQGTAIGGAGLTINLPNGVAVAADANGNVGSNVAAPAAAVLNKASVLAIFTAATPTMNARLNVAVASTSATGFTTGELATIACIVNAGTPTAGGFSITDFKPVDLNGAAITGLTAGFTAEIQ